MAIAKKRVMNVRSYLSELPPGASFRFSVPVESVTDRLEKVGFSADPEDGDTLLPAALGPVSRFNSEGRWIVRRDLPKELKYTRTVYWRWTQWAPGGGTEECEDFRDIYRMCYCKDFVTPPAVELTVSAQEGAKKIISPMLNNDPSADEHLRHVLNLFLELFGICSIEMAGGIPLSSPAPRKVNWKFLPPGRYPWDRLEEAIDAVVGNASDGVRRVIWDRQETLKAFVPTEIFIGEGGFRDYVAYVFAGQGFVVLESIRRGNAIYVFGSNWQTVSRLSKADVLSNHFHLARIVHVKGWKRKLAQLFSKSSAAE